MLGSWLVVPVAVCEAAVPLIPHSHAVDRIATAERATEIDRSFVLTCLPNPGMSAVPVRVPHYVSSRSVRVGIMLRRSRVHHPCSPQWKYSMYLADFRACPF